MIYFDLTHMIADSEDELHGFAQSIGLKREWYQAHSKHPHYDITTARMRNKVLSQPNVQQVTSREIIMKGRNNGW